jgi:hypothetical protein
MYRNYFSADYNTTTNGKIFVMFIATIIRTYLTTKLSKLAYEKSLSMREIFDRLCDIIITSNGGDLRLNKAITTEQKNIPSIFNLENEIIKSIQNLNKNKQNQ